MFIDNSTGKSPTIGVTTVESAAGYTADYAALDLDPRQSAAWLKDKREHWAKVVQRAGIIAE